MAFHRANSGSLSGAARIVLPRTPVCRKGGGSAGFDRGRRQATAITWPQASASTGAGICGRRVGAHVSGQGFYDWRSCSAAGFRFFGHSRKSGHDRDERCRHDQGRRLPRCGQQPRWSINRICHRLCGLQNVDGEGRFRQGTTVHQTVLRVIDHFYRAPSGAHLCGSLCKAGSRFSSTFFCRNNSRHPNSLDSRRRAAHSLDAAHGAPIERRFHNRFFCACTAPGV